MTGAPVAAPRVAAPPVAATASYLICCLPRSGSWLLADALKATGVAGVPEEYYWHEFYDDYCGHWQLSGVEHYGQFLDQTLRVGTTANGVFGAKLHWDELQELTESLRTLPGTAGLDAMALLRRFFPDPTFVYLSRADKVRQAISWFRAGATAQWYRVHGEAGRVAELQPDWQRILVLERKLRADERAWVDFFARGGVEPITVAYEDLATDYTGTVDRVLRGLGVTLPEGFTHPQPRLEQQRTTTTEEWVQRYLVARRGLR